MGHYSIGRLNLRPRDISVSELSGQSLQDFLKVSEFMETVKEVNRKEVDNPKDFQQAIKHGAKEHSALLLMQEGQSTRYVALDIA